MLHFPSRHSFWHFTQLQISVTIFIWVVCRLVTKDTVDENVYEIAKRKLVLDAAVLETGLEVDNEGASPEKTMGEILSSLLLG